MQKLCELAHLIRKTPRTNQLQELATHLADARAFIRLLESLREIHRLVLIQREASSINKSARIGNTLSWILYWIFENISILAKHKIINASPTFFTKAGYVCLLSHFLTKIYVLYNDYISSKEEYKRRVIKFEVLRETVDVIGILPYVGVLGFLAKCKCFIGIYAIWDCFCAYYCLAHECTV